MLKKKVLYENVKEAQNQLKALRSEYSQSDKLTWGIIPAAGKGLRFGQPIPKQYQTICNETVLKRSITALSTMPTDAHLFLVLVVLSEDDFYFEKLEIGKLILNDLSIKTNVFALKVGKETRKKSVIAGLQFISAIADDNDWVLVHDAARPGLTKNSLQRLWNEVHKYENGGILALPVNDTLKKEKDNILPNHENLVEKTIPRENCWVAQTPQIFPFKRLFLALKSVDSVTDESSAMEAMGNFPKLVYGDLLNLKITKPEDLKFMEIQMSYKNKSHKSSSLFVGQGFDVHQLVKGRKLVLGGVKINHETGLMGHSDADVLIHAVIDAIVGAAALGDIGKLFPDSNSEFENIDSRLLLRKVREKIYSMGLLINQIDSTIIAEKPKLGEYINQMVNNIQNDTYCDLVNVKATTTEKLGFIGKEEGIAAQAIVSLTSV